MRNLHSIKRVATVECCSLPEDKSSGVLRHLVRGMILTQRPGVLVMLAGRREMYKSCGERPAHRHVASVGTPGAHSSPGALGWCLNSLLRLRKSRHCDTGSGVLSLVVLGVGHLLAARAAGLLQLLRLQFTQAAVLAPTAQQVIWIGSFQGVFLLEASRRFQDVHRNVAKISC